MSWRKIIVEDKEYRWKCGESFVTVQNSSGKRVALEHCYSVAGMTPDAWDIAKRKRGASILPYHIETLIRRSSK